MKQIRLSRRAALGATLGLAGAAASIHIAGASSGANSLAPLLSYGDWLSVRPGEADLHGRVVLVDVFTFACYNCANVTPNLRTLHRTKPSADLAIVGIHTPETPYERDRANVVANLKRLGIVWPVAIDNDNRLWNAYGIEYWPTQLFFDRSGRLRKTVIGDSQDDLVDRIVAGLIRQRNAPRSSGSYDRARPPARRCESRSSRKSPQDAGAPDRRRSALRSRSRLRRSARRSRCR